VGGLRAVVSRLLLDRVHEQGSGADPAKRGQQPADRRRLDQADPWQRPCSGGGGSRDTLLGLVAPRALGPLASGLTAPRPHSSVWLALPADWQEHWVLRHTARELGRMGGL
jgi:hypothetical protein